MVSTKPSPTSSRNPLAEPRRLDSLDAARAVAALLVFCQHGFEKWVPLFKTGFAILNLGQAGVVCFFLISGFVIPYSLQSHGSLLKYVIARFFRIFPLYWFVLIAAAVALRFKMPVLGPDAPYSLSWRSLLVHLFMIQSLFKIPNLVGISWTLVVEIIFYFVTAFLFLMKLQSLLRFIVAGCGLVLAGSLYGWWFHKAFPIYPAALILTAFAGQAVEYHWSKKITGLQAGLIFILVLLTCLASISLREAVSPYIITTKSACVSWTAGYAVFLIFLFTHYKSGILSFLGRISYSIYLLHTYFIAFAFHYLTPCWSAVGICLAATLAASMLTYRVIEQPGIALGRNLFRLVHAKLAA